MIEANETHEKIISVLKEKGPSLPINISKDIGMSSLFVSAFLSELTNGKKIKVSHLKVGGSPLYFLEGQEGKLEDFFNYLPSREADAFLLLKKFKVLKDSQQEPAIRVALRSIRDFAFGFKKGDEIYWRYILVPESEIRNLLNPEKKVKVIEKSVNNENEASNEEIENRDEKIVKPEIKIEESENVENIGKNNNEFNNPLAYTPVKTQEIRLKSDFVQNVVDFIGERGFKIIEEKEFKAKEYNAVVRINSELGFIDFLTQAKDKKTIAESDLKKLLSNAQSIPLPALLIYTGSIGKKSSEYLEKYNSILKSARLVSKQ
jgi:hypothetical protein